MKLQYHYDKPRESEHVRHLKENTSNAFAMEIFFSGPT